MLKILEIRVQLSLKIIMKMKMSYRVKKQENIMLLITIECYYIIFNTLFYNIL
jgi:hypothetical protein